MLFVPIRDSASSHTFPADSPYRNKFSSFNSRFWDLTGADFGDDGGERYQADLVGNLLRHLPERFPECRQPVFGEPVGRPNDGDRGDRVPVFVENRLGDRIDLLFVFLFGNGIAALDRYTQIFHHLLD